MIPLSAWLRALRQRIQLLKYQDEILLDILERPIHVDTVSDR
jgi:hypothetical protein